MKPPAVFDMISLLAVLASIAALLRGRTTTTPAQRTLLGAVSGLLALCLFRDFSNVLEWSGITSALDRFEDYTEILTPVVWAFLFHTFGQIASREGLRRSEERFRLLFENTGTAVIYLDVNGTMILLNKQAAKCLNGKPEDFAGKYAYDLLPSHSGLIKDRFRKILESGKGMERENLLQLPIGERWFRSSLQPVRDTDGKIIGIQVLSRDITDHKKMEDQLRQSEKMQAIGRLAGGIAHDFNNQLTGIMGCADMLRAGLTQEEDKDLYELADIIVKTAQRSSRLTGQLLAFARKGKYRSVPMSIHSVIGEVVSMLEHSIQKNVRIRQHLDATIPTVQGDPSLLENTFLNLALNARDAMPDGGELVFATTTLELDHEFCERSQFDITPGRYVRVSVKDSGVGMSPETKERIFEPFFTTKEKGKGVGMGLPAAYGAVKVHHGAIDVEGEPGKGSTFIVYIPTADLQEDLQRSDISGKHAPDGIRILLIEDDSTVRKTVARMLKDQGHNIVERADGAEAVEVYETDCREIDLVVLDMVMPRMGGRATFAALREVNPRVKVLLSSGYSLDSEARVILDEGALGFIQKPFTSAELAEKIAEVLAA